MRKIPPKLREILANDPYYLLCARRSDSGCDGRITWEHAFIYAGRQVNERWAIIPLCEYHHLREGLDKEKNQAIALLRASNADLLKYPKANWLQRKRYLFSKHANFLRHATA